MHEPDHISLAHLIASQPSVPFFPGGLFLDPITTLPPSLVSFFWSKTQKKSLLHALGLGSVFCESKRAVGSNCGVGFFSVSLSIKRNKGEGDDGDEDENKGFVGESEKVLGQNGNDEEPETEMVRYYGAVNTTKHLWAGAVSAIFSRTFVAPLERLKLEYILRGEQKNLLQLIRSIAASEGLKGFWKGNFVNILRTAPSKAIDFYAYDAYKNQLMKMSGNEETTNFQRFLAGAAAGITATLFCLPLDTIRTKMVAPGGGALGGVISALHHTIQTEGFFALYKGLAPTILSMAPSSAVFYGVYDILKSAYVHSPEGKERIENMKQGQELNALDKLELGPIRTLLYGAIAGACSEITIYPLDVLRKQLQMQVRSTRLSAMSTCVKIVEQGGIPALYAGLVPSLLQVLPAAAISYFVYEFLKIVLKVESS